MAVFRCFFGRNKFSRPNCRLSPIACHTYLESLGPRDLGSSLRTYLAQLVMFQSGFQDCKEVSKTEFVNFSLATFLAITGGSLGLCLCLCLLQPAQILVQQGAKVGKLENVLKVYYLAANCCWARTFQTRLANFHFLNSPFEIFIQS